MSKEKKNVGELIGTALISFIATNTDDLVVLMSFFTEASLPNSLMKARHVFIGQYLGFIILLGFSLIGYALSYAIPIQMLGFLGFFPIFLGIKGFIELILEWYKNSSTTMNEIVGDNGVHYVKLEPILYGNDIDEEIVFEIKIEEEEESSTVDHSLLSPPTFKQKLIKFLNHFCSPQILKVASVTLANSGDNVAIYTPLFAQAFEWQIVVYIIIFLILVFVWLIASYLFINSRPVLTVAQNYAHIVVPFVFVGLGIYIIITSECFPWLVKAIQTKNFKNG